MIWESNILAAFFRFKTVSLQFILEQLKCSDFYGISPEHIVVDMTMYPVNT
jgi:hypothetical protein